MSKNDNRKVCEPIDVKPKMSWTQYIKEILTLIDVVDHLSVTILKIFAHLRVLLYHIVVHDIQRGIKPACHYLS